MQDKDVNEQITQIGHDAYSKASNAVKETVLRIHRETDSKNGADVIRAMTYGGLGALVPCAIAIAKHRDLPEGLTPPATPRDVKPEHGEFVYQNVKPETLTYAALVLVQMLEKITNEVTSIGFGPIQLREALTQWKLLFPLAKPEDWINSNILQCIGQVEEAANAPVEELMAKLKKASPGSSTLH